MDYANASSKQSEEKRQVISSVLSAIAEARDGQLEALKRSISQHPWLVDTARDEVTSVNQTIFINLIGNGASFKAK